MTTATVQHPTVLPDDYELTILMPCLNEAETLEACIVKAQSFPWRSGILGEVLIADNGSTDGSREISTRHGARIVNVATPGYGAALLGGIEAAHGRYIVMGDPLADAVVELYKSLPGGRGRALLDQALAHGIDSIAEPPRALLDLFAQVDHEPIWLDRDKLADALAGLAASRHIAA